jgi:hypothetical protein
MARSGCPRFERVALQASGRRCVARTGRRDQPVIVRIGVDVLGGREAIANGGNVTMVLMVIPVASAWQSIRWKADGGFAECGQSELSISSAARS